MSRRLWWEGWGGVLETGLTKVEASPQAESPQIGDQRTHTLRPHSGASSSEKALLAVTCTMSPQKRVSSVVARMG